MNLKNRKLIRTNLIEVFNEKIILACFLTLATIPTFGMGNDKDYSFSIYGKKAVKYFNKLPKLNSKCAYIENKVDKDGNTDDNVKLVIQGQTINSILCVLVGEQTHACEASTLWISEPCKSH